MADVELVFAAGCVEGISILRNPGVGRRWETSSQVRETTTLVPGLSCKEPRWFLAAPAMALLDRNYHSGLSLDSVDGGD